MVILGLGSNIGDRLTHLRQALRFLKAIPELKIEQISPIYMSDALLPHHADNSWNTPYLNLAIRCQTTLTPLALLEKTKMVEKKMGRDASIDWSPRIIDIDILAWDDLIKYDDKLHIPHEHLHERPFALWPLADVAPFWIYPLPGPWKGKTAMELAAQWKRDAAPLHTRPIAQRIDTPALVGIINLTPDSFSDGGKYFDSDQAVQQMVSLVNDGAEIIDIGAEATGPRATPIHSVDEWKRLEPVLALWNHAKSTTLIEPKISIDTRHVDTAEKALTWGANWINDVTGLDNPEMRALVSQQSADILFMHHLGVPVSQSKLIPLNEDPVAHVYQWAEKRLQELDISPERLIFDIGIGYGKTAEQSIALIKNISLFKSLGIRLLVGHSRKSFLSLVTHKPTTERDIETIAISNFLADQHIDFLRIHNVDYHARLFKTKACITN